MKSIFLESHHIKNLFFGFGQFNYHLLKGLSQISDPAINMTVHGENPELLKKEFGESFSYKKYYSLRRYPLFRIRKKYDLWHSLNQNTQIEPYHNLPYLLTVHNISHIKDPDNYRHLENHVKFQEKLNRSTAITYISNYAKESTRQFFDVPNVPEHIIYNGNPIQDIVPPADYNPAFAINKPFLFTIGEITERKNFKSLVSMMPFLPDFNLIIAGKKSTAEAAQIETLIVKLGLGNRVSLVGKISETDKQYFYQNCAAFVFPSLREGFGLPVIEAMRFGKPVFISNNTSLPEIGGEIANYWNHYDPEYMAKIIEEGLHEYSKDISGITDKLVARSAEFNWKNAAEQYHNVYRSILKP